MKTIQKWSNEETNNLIKLFGDIDFNTHNHSKMEMIHIRHQQRFPERTQKAIERKLYRLGYTNYTIHSERTDYYKCEDCGSFFERPKRYKSKVLYCKDCREKHKNDNWKNKKIYMKMYNEKRRNRI